MTVYTDHPMTFERTRVLEECAKALGVALNFIRLEAESLHLAGRHKAAEANESFIADARETLARLEATEEPK